MYLSQKGFAQILALGGLFILAASLGAGIYLVKQRTNVAPKAEDLRPITNVTGSASSADAPLPNFPFQIPEFIQKLVPTAAPSPVPTLTAQQPQPTTPAGTVLTPVPTAVVNLTPTPNPTLIPTFFPTPPPSGVVCTQDVHSCPDGSFVGRIPPNCEFAPCPFPVPTSPVGSISAPIPPQRNYRVSFDPAFNILVDTGDGGVFGSGNEKTVNLTLTGGAGPKSVYIQFYENGQWVPVTPVIASINLISSAANASSAVSISPSPVVTYQLPGTGKQQTLYQLLEPPAQPASAVPEVPNLSGTCEPELEVQLNQIRNQMISGAVDDWYKMQWGLNNSGTCSVEGAIAVGALELWIYQNKTGKQVGSGPYPLDPPGVCSFGTMQYKVDITCSSGLSCNFSSIYPNPCDNYPVGSRCMCTSTLVPDQGTTTSCTRSAERVCI